MSVDRLVSRLADTDKRVRNSALVNLTKRVNDSFGPDAITLSQELRVHGGIECLVHLLEDWDPKVQQCSLSLIGTLLTDAFEPNARDSLSIFIRIGGLSLLVAQLRKKDPNNLFAAACTQNITALDPKRCCESLVALGARPILESIVANESDGLDPEVWPVLTLIYLGHISCCKPPARCEWSICVCSSRST